MGGGKIVVSDNEDDYEEEDGESVNEEEEEEEEEGQDEYEKDGFIVDEVDEEEEEEEDVEDERQRKKRKKKRRESEKHYELDEDDYELLQDNNITGFRRPNAGSKFKRLKKAGRDSEVGTSSGNSKEKIKLGLFGDDGGVPMEDIAEEEEQQENENEYINSEDDEMGDFIVDEEEANVKKKNLKKKKTRHTPGVSPHALQEAHEIFGDVDELLMQRKQYAMKASGDSGLGGERLEDEFEPLILSEKYMTQKDEIIRNTDVPERIQLFEEITGSPPTDDHDIKEESEWIYSRLKEGDVCQQGIDEIKENIRNVLTMLHVKKFELPFIAMYRKEFCQSLLQGSDGLSEGEHQSPIIRWHKLLWEVHTLDKNWLLLRKRKNVLQTYYVKRFEEEVRRVDEETRLALNRKLFVSIKKALEGAESEREVDDIDAKFSLHFPPREVGLEESQYKRPQRKSLYSVCHKTGLWEVSNMIGCSPEQLGKHLTKDEVQSFLELEDRKEAPDEVAGNFTCGMFKTRTDVLKGARHMAATEIGWEPIVKKCIRGVYMTTAVLSTSPTSKGRQTIDAYHEFAHVKWLRDKPLSAFDDAQWLLIQKAEEEKTLQVTIKLPEDVYKSLYEDALRGYMSDRVSRFAQLWNEQRELILKDSFSNIILPAMEKEARALLTIRAKKWALAEYGRQLWSRVSVAPPNKKNGAENNSGDESGLRVMACCWGPGQPATTFVMLDSAGEVIDVLYAGSISKRSLSDEDKERKQLDQQRLLKFMTDHQPHVACLGNASLSCRQLKDDIFEVIFKIVEDHPRDVSQDMNINIIYTDESLPRLYENSRVSSEQLPGQPGIVKRAVALGRYLQNPLAMVATLCGPGKEILSWKFCPLEQFLSPDEKFEMVEQIMVDATNQVGLDINLAASHEWLFSSLQFISGLGPRKASALQKAFVRAGSVLSRKEIPMGKILRKKVFVNAVGFIRVRRSGAAASSSHIMDLLDDTRIHPEWYYLAKDMAKYAINADNLEGADEMDDYDEEMAIEHVRENPENLERLDIDYYDAGTTSKETLYLIKMELKHGFRDWRVPFRDLTPEEEFFMLTGETEDSLSAGRIVQVTVRQVQDNRVFCMFDSGLKGFIMAEDFSDDGYDPEKIQEGDILTCKIKYVNQQRVLVYLTCKGSEMRKMPPSNPKRDRYYNEDMVNIHSEQEKAYKEREHSRKYFKPRMIVHPRFQNLTADEATQYIADKDAGESIIHPSSKGPMYLTLTIKIFDGVYAQKNIVESGKDHKDVTSLLRLGKTLMIDKDTFEDLDEIMDRYVDPLACYLKKMLNYRKFKRGKRDEVDDLLRSEKAANPTRIAYCFGILHEYPGAFILSYIRNLTPHHEYVGLYPTGFRYRKKDFQNIDKLVAYFQRNIDKPPPGASPSLRTVAAMVPMKSPATWGSPTVASTRDEPGASKGRWKEQTNSAWSPNLGTKTGGKSDGDAGKAWGSPSGPPSPASDHGWGNSVSKANDKGGVWGTPDTGRDSNNDKGSGWGTSGSYANDRGGGWGTPNTGKDTTNAGKDNGWHTSGSKANNKDSGWGNLNTGKDTNFGKGGGWGSSGSKANDMGSGWGTPNTGSGTNFGKGGGWGSSGVKANDMGSGSGTPNTGSDINTGKGDRWGSSGSKANDLGSGWGKDTNTSKGGGWGSSGSKANDLGSGWGTDTNTGKGGGWGSSGSKANDLDSGWGTDTNTGKCGGWGSSGSKASNMGGGWGSKDNNPGRGGDWSGGTTGGSRRGGGDWGDKIVNATPPYPANAAKVTPIKSSWDTTDSGKGGGWGSDDWGRKAVAATAPSPASAPKVTPVKSGWGTADAGKDTNYGKGGGWGTSGSKASDKGSGWGTPNTTGKDTNISGGGGWASNHDGWSGGTKGCSTNGGSGWGGGDWGSKTVVAKVTPVESSWGVPDTGKDTKTSVGGGWNNSSSKANDKGSGWGIANTSKDTSSVGRGGGWASNRDGWSGGSTAAGSGRGGSGWGGATAPSPAGAAKSTPAKSGWGN